MDKTISDVADILQEASEKLRKATEGQSAESNSGNSSSTESTSASTRSRDGRFRSQTVDEESRNTFHQTLLRARNMITGSLSAGGNRGLNRRERLRSAAPYSETKANKTAKKDKKKPAKPIEFALLKCYDDEDIDDDEHTLKWDSVIANGIIMVEEDGNETNI